MMSPLRVLRVVTLSYCKPCVWPFVWGVVCQYNILLRHTKPHQLSGEAGLRTILLNPDFALADVHVQQTVVNTMALLPAQEQHLMRNWPSAR